MNEKMIFSQTFVIKEPPEVFYQKVFLKILLKRRLWYKCFPVNFVKFLRTAPDGCFYTNDPNAHIPTFCKRWYNDNDRSSHRRSIKKVALKNFSKFVGKHECRSLFFNKVARRKFVFCEFCEAFKNSYFVKYLQTACFCSYSGHTAQYTDQNKLRITEYFTQCYYEIHQNIVDLEF